MVNLIIQFNNTRFPDGHTGRYFITCKVYREAVRLTEIFAEPVNQPKFKSAQNLVVGSDWADGERKMIVELLDKEDEENATSLGRARITITKVHMRKLKNGYRVFPLARFKDMDDELFGTVDLSLMLLAGFRDEVLPVPDLAPGARGGDFSVSKSAVVRLDAVDPEDLDNDGVVGRLWCGMSSSESDAKRAVPGQELATAVNAEVLCFEARRGEEAIFPGVGFGLGSVSPAEQNNMFLLNDAAEAGAANGFGIAINSSVPRPIAQLLMRAAPGTSMLSVSVQDIAGFNESEVEDVLVIVFLTARYKEYRDRLVRSRGSYAEFPRNCVQISEQDLDGDGVRVMKDGHGVYRCSLPASAKASPPLNMSAKGALWKTNLLAPRARLDAAKGASDAQDTALVVELFRNEKGTSPPEFLGHSMLRLADVAKEAEGDEEEAVGVAEGGDEKAPPADGGDAKAAEGDAKAAEEGGDAKGGEDGPAGPAGDGTSGAPENAPGPAKPSLGQDDVWQLKRKLPFLEADISLIGQKGISMKTITLGLDCELEPEPLPEEPKDEKKAGTQAPAPVPFEYDGPTKEQMEQSQKLLDILSKNQAAMLDRLGNISTKFKDVHDEFDNLKDGKKDVDKQKSLQMAELQKLLEDANNRVRDARAEAKEALAKQKEGQDALKTCGVEIVKLRREVATLREEATALKEPPMRLEQARMLSEKLERMTLDEMKDLVVKMESSLWAQQGRTEAVEKKAADFLRQLKEAEQKLSKTEELQKAHLEQTAFIQKLHKRLHAARTQLESFNVDKYTQTITNQSKIIAKLEGILAKALDTDRSKEQKKVLNAMNQLTEENQSLRKENIDVKTDLNVLKSKEPDDLPKLLQEARKEIQKLKSDQLKGNSEKISALEKELKDSKAQTAELQKKLKSSESLAKDSVGKNQKFMAKLEQDNKELKKKNEELKKQNQELKKKGGGGGGGGKGGDAKEGGNADLNIWRFRCKTLETKLSTAQNQLTKTTKKLTKKYADLKIQLSAAKIKLKVAGIPDT